MEEGAMEENLMNAFGLTADWIFPEKGRLS